jgi:putative transposase
MVRYRRNFLPGGTYFFTVTLSDRRSTALVDHVSELRDAFRVARRERPFAVEAVVILPDHLHAIFTLPPDDADFSGRWRRIKGHFSSALIDAGIEMKRNANGDLALWQRRFWEHTVRNEDDSRGMSIIFISILSSMVWCRVCAIGPIHHFTDMCGRRCWHRIGPAMPANAEQILENGWTGSPP